ncbi:hypothetical protein ACWYXO_12415 [Janthinobacterium aestuarii]
MLTAIDIDIVLSGRTAIPVIKFVKLINTAVHPARQCYFTAALQPLPAFPLFADGKALKNSRSFISPQGLVWRSRRYGGARDCLPAQKELIGTPWPAGSGCPLSSASPPCCRVYAGGWLKIGRTGKYRGFSPKLYVKYRLDRP